MRRQRGGAAVVGVGAPITPEPEAHPATPAGVGFCAAPAGPWCRPSSRCSSPPSGAWCSTSCTRPGSRQSDAGATRGCGWWHLLLPAPAGQLASLPCLERNTMMGWFARQPAGLCHPREQPKERMGSGVHLFYALLPHKSHCCTCCGLLLCNAHCTLCPCLFTSIELR